MKKLAIATIFAIAAISSAAVSATVGSKPADHTAKASPVMPVTQELPFDRYWSKD